MSGSKVGTAIQGHRLGIEEALASIPGPKGERFAEVFMATGVLGLVFVGLALRMVFQEARAR
jgi:hypothetical protein